MAAGEVQEKQLEASDPDVRLMLRVRADDVGAFEELVARYQDRLLGVLVHLIGRVEEAEDLTQEVFWRVYRARKSYQPRARFSTWLFTIAHHLAWNHLRGRARLWPARAQRRADSRAQPAEGRLPSPDGTPSAQLRRVELSEVVREALATLAEDQRLAVLLNKFEGMGYAEIAGIMHRSESAIKSLLARARANLREQLEPYLLTGRRGREH